METIKPCAEQFKVVLKTSLEFLLAQSIAVQDYWKGIKGEDAIQTVRPEGTPDDWVLEKDSGSRFFWGKSDWIPRTGININWNRKRRVQLNTCREAVVSRGMPRSSKPNRRVRSRHHPSGHRGLPDWAPGKRFQRNAARKRAHQRMA